MRDIWPARAEKSKDFSRGSSPRLSPASDHLTWHSIEAGVKEIAPDYRSVGELLLAEAEDAGSDLVVIVNGGAKWGQLVVGVIAAIFGFAVGKRAT